MTPEQRALRAANRPPTRLTPRGEKLAGWAGVLVFLFLMALVGGFDASTLP